MVGVCANTVSFGHGGGPLILTPLTWKLAAALASVLYAVPFCLNRLRRTSDGSTAEWTRRDLHPLPFVAALLVLVFTDFPERRTAFHLARIVFAGTGAMATLVFLLFRNRAEQSSGSRALTVALFIVQAVLTAGFLKEADGRLLWSDDHPSFLYRLILLRDHFPFIPFYNPSWNAGYSAREVYPTGALNLYLLGYPFVHWLGDISNFQKAAIYNDLIPYILLFVVPWSLYFAARSLRLTAFDATIAALLAMGPTMSLFEFALRYGTLPFVISSALVPLFLALLARVAFDDEHPRVALIAVTVLVGFLCCTWHLIVLSFVPAGAVLLFRFGHLRRGGRLKAIFSIGVLIALLSAPSLVTIAQESQLFDLTKRNSLPGSSNEVSTVQAAKQKEDTEARRQRDGAASEAPPPLSLRELRASFALLAAKANPLFVVLCFPALFAFPRGPKRQILGFSIAWLVTVSVLGQHFKPQFELHRFFLTACFVSAVPIAFYIGKLLSECRRALRPEKALLTRAGAMAVLCSFVVLGSAATIPHTLMQVYTNNTIERFRFAPPETREFLDALRKNSGTGRTFFTGFILHDFGTANYKAQDGGHIAPLAAFAGIPMYASQYYHTVWSTVDPIPKSYLDRDDAGIEEFLDLVNATSVVTFKREWTSYCQAKARYHEVWHEGRFHLFTRDTDKGSYFLEGSGEVSSAAEGIQIVPTSTDSVLKFRWFPKLRTSAPEDALIEPVPVFKEEIGGERQQQVSFIRLKVSPEVVANRRAIRIGYFAH